MRDTGKTGGSFGWTPALICTEERPRLRDMSEVLKIGVIYGEALPQMLAEAGTGAEPWHFEFFREASVLRTPVAPRPDFLAVFCPYHKSPVLSDHASRIFPGAEIILYRLESEGPPGESHPQDPATPVVQLPINPVLAHHLLDNLARIRAGRMEQLCIQNEADDLRAVLDGFVRIMESASASAERKEAMNLWLRQLIRRMNAEEGIIYASGNAGLVPERLHTTGNIRDLDLFEHQANHAILKQVLNTGNPYLDNDCAFEIQVPLAEESRFIRSILCYPLEYRSERVGVIEILNSAAGGFKEQDRSLMELMARPLAVAINNMRLFDQAEQLTVTDDLTKLYNYRYLKQYLEAEVKRCLRYKKKVSLLFIDVDGFKRVNDTFGHLVGSHALAEIGQLLRRILRETDVVGRYGGDEFVVVLPETPLTGALVIAERIRKSIEDYVFVAQDLTIRLTVSLGISNCPKHTLTAKGLIKKADAAMYRAKELSKNNVKIAV